MASGFLSPLFATTRISSRQALAEAPHEAGYWQLWLLTWSKARELAACGFKLRGIQPYR
ncbi:hypothetical protein E4U54_001579 [Claviceps lovelessii]|nr:hypothetical protein E4U54_001579 [Claviceps lovelessii]